MASSEDLEKINKELQLQIQQLRWQIEQMQSEMKQLKKYSYSYSPIGTWYKSTTPRYIYKKANGLP